MKKVRIMLTAIAILAVVGGALAFKAGTNPNTRYCYKTGTAVGTCTTTAPVDFTANSGSGIRYTTTSNVSNCTTLNCPTAANTVVAQ